MSSSVLHAVYPSAAAFSLLGWLPWGRKLPPLEDADYTSKEAAQAPVPEARLKDVQVRQSLGHLDYVLASGNRLVPLQEQGNLHYECGCISS